MSGVSRPPKKADGSYDKEAIKAMFMASKYMDWTRFAEDQGWDALLVRRELPVRTWLKEKRDILAEKQMDILSGLIHERKFQWTHEIIKTLDNYPKAIDMVLELAKAKMNQYFTMYADYMEWVKDPLKVWTTKKGGQKVRNTHPFERLSALDVSMLMRGMKDITDAKLKALMLDKWAITKFDLPVEAEITDEQGGSQFGPRFTIEGKEVIEARELQSWFDQYFDKPPELPPETVTAEPVIPTKDVKDDGGS